MDAENNPFHPYSDWRVSLLGKEESAIWILYVVGLVSATVVLLLHTPLLWYYIVYKKHKVFRFMNGVFKPSPVQAYLVSTTIFVVGRMVFSAMMISGKFGYGKVQNEGYIMEAFHEWPWGFGYGGIALYLVGIMFATPDSIKDPSLSAVYLPSPQQMNIFCLFMIALPMFLANLFAGIAGYYFNVANMTMALRLTQAHYWVWGAWCLLLMFSCIFFGRQLNRLIAATINQQRQSKNPTNVATLEAARMRLARVTFTVTMVLFAYTIAIIAYATGQRAIITKSRAVSLIFCTLWNFSAPGLMFIIGLFLAHGVYQEQYKLPGGKYYRQQSGHATNSTGSHTRFMASRTGGGTTGPIIADKESTRPGALGLVSDIPA
ncbi:hypothetical protein DFS34DRAFT_633998 [Phlyctochytrium arcticum]|nr:hypothetical protein DFS34DRAFT_633998 [Phlyctochytrium arcticum]